MKLIWKISIVFITSIILFLLFILFHQEKTTAPQHNLNSKDDHNSDTSEKRGKAIQDQDSKPEMKKKTLYFIPAVKFKSERSNITTTELKKTKLYSTKENEAVLPEGFDIELVEDTQISSLISDGKIALLQPSEISPTYKSLAVDGVNYWNDPLNNYPLNMTIEVPKIDNSIEPKSTTIFATGEIIPARAVDRLGLNVFNNYTYIFDFFKEDMKNADLTIGLLENPLLGDPKPCTGCLVFIGDEKMMKGIKDIGYDFISSAGNHAGDAGAEGYKRTIELFKENGIEFSGTGVSSDQKPNIAKKVIDGITYGMIGADEVAYFYDLPSWERPRGEGNTYGLYSFSSAKDGRLVIDEERVKYMKTLKQEYEIDYLIIYMSWGTEYQNKANGHQTQLAHLLIDNGVDLIIGSHPHWVQNIEFYKGKPIIYSMGNFIFDQQHTLPTRQAINVRLHYLDNNLKWIELLPHQTCGYYQTSNNITKKYLEGYYSLSEVYKMPEGEGCVYFQPKKLRPDNPSYQQILNRVFEHTEI